MRRSVVQTLSRSFLRSLCSISKLLDDGYSSPIGREDILHVCCVSPMVEDYVAYHLSVEYKTDDSLHHDTGE